MPDKKGDEHVAFTYYVPVAIVLIGLVARACFFFHESLWPDEALYLSMAERLVSNPFDLTDCCGDPYYNNPPFFMYLLALLFSLTDNTSVIAARLVPLAAAAGTIAVTYVVGKELFGKSVGTISALLVAFNPLHLWISTRVLSDVPMTFLLYFGMLMLMIEKRKLFYLFSILGLMTKYHAAPAIILPSVSAFFQKKPRLALAFFLLGVCGLVVFVSFRSYMDFENPALVMIRSKFRPPDFHEIIKETNFFLDPIVFAFFVIGFIISVKNGQFSHVFIWIVLFGIVRIFLPWVAFRVSRYTLPIYPGIFIFAAYGAIQSFSTLKDKFPRRALPITVIFISIGCYVGFTYVDKAIAVTKQNNGTFLGFEEAGGFLSKQNGQDLSILTASPCQIKYFAKELTVFDLPKKAAIEDAKRMIAENGIDYVALDVWSPHQPKWVTTQFSTQNGFSPVFKNKYIIIFETGQPH